MCIIHVHVLHLCHNNYVINVLYCIVKIELGLPWPHCIKSSLIVMCNFLQTLPLVLSLRTVILQTFVHPYEDWKANYTESLVMLTLVILLALGNTSPLVASTRNMEQFTLWPLLYLPVIVGAGYVLILIAYTAW